MDVEQDPSEDSGTPGVNQLVDAARQYGADDQYAGKRNGTRYRAGMPLEVSTDPNNPAVTTSVIMENASSGGCSFWSRRELAPGGVVFVRQFLPDGVGNWLPAEVHHCTMGLRGFLVGVAFATKEQQETAACAAPHNASSTSRVQGSAPQNAPLTDAGPPAAVPPGTIDIAKATDLVPNRSGLLRRLRSARKKK